jgi:hypothetical protein
MSADSFLKKLSNKTGLAAAATNDLINELTRREKTENPFPLSVFHESVKPFINALESKYKIPDAFIGLTLLSLYSASIGTKYTVSTNKTDGIYLPIWACLLGMTSSGKSMVIGKIFKPLQNKQQDLDEAWKEDTKDMSDYEVNRQRMETILYRDSHIATLAKSVLPDNPKGVCKMSDELLEWLNGMDSLSKKEGTDQQFWLSSWNCTPYSAIRSGKVKFFIPRPFVGVIGGAQPSVLWKVFSKDRDTSGFISRILFAIPTENMIADPDPFFEMPKEFSDIHDKSVLMLWNSLRVDDAAEAPSKGVLTQEGVTLFNTWKTDHVKRINSMADQHQQEMEAAILGKLTEYTLRFCCILHLSDKAIDAQTQPTNADQYFKQTEHIEASTVVRAIKLSEYFFKSALKAYELAEIATTAPKDVLVTATLFKNGKSIAQIAEIVLGKKDPGSKTKMNRLLKKWIKDYPRVFGAIAR